MTGEQDAENSFAVDSDVAVETRPSPSDDWPNPSWLDPSTNCWWWQGKPDPCPVRPLGTADGEHVYVTPFGEMRRFTSAALHGGGGLADLFSGSLSWPLRHFRKFDFEKQVQVGELQREECIAALMRRCVQAGYYDGSRPHRGVGVWRGLDREPIVHAGNRIFHRGEVIDPV
jgi:hypothetical protein